jgi:hypothetical protein
MKSLSLDPMDEVREENAKLKGIPMPETPPPSNVKKTDEDESSDELD